MTKIVIPEYRPTDMRDTTLPTYNGLPPLQHDPKSTRMNLVILESPFAGDVASNIEYARAAVRDSLSRGEAPIASHLLYTQDGILDDDIPDERQWGIDAGLAWHGVSTGTVVYTDRGTSRGMEYGIAAARKAGRDVEFRSIESSEPKDE